MISIMRQRGKASNVRVLRDGARYHTKTAFRAAPHFARIQIIIPITHWNVFPASTNVIHEQHAEITLHCDN